MRERSMWAVVRETASAQASGLYSRSGARGLIRLVDSVPLRRRELS